MKVVGKELQVGETKKEYKKRVKRKGRNVFFWKKDCWVGT